MDKEEARITIGTHNGWFHADEVLATVFLKYLNKPNEVEIIRTRDENILKDLDYVVDVGQIYDPKNCRFDHHQRDCKETFSEKFSTIPLSSAGMVYKEYGKKLIRKFIDEDWGEEIADEINLDDLQSRVYVDLYKRFILEVDANDNGVPMIKKEMYDYKLFNYTQYLNLPGHVRSLNGRVQSDNEEQLKRFKEAQKLCWDLFCIHLRSSIKYQISYLHDDEPMRKAFNERNHPNILFMKKNYPTWSLHLRELDKNNEVKFTIYPRDTEGKNWGFSTMQSISFENDIDLLDNQVLNVLMINPDDLIFVHKNLFCGAAKSVEAAFEVCKLSYDHRSKLVPIKRQLNKLVSTPKAKMWGLGIMMGVIGYILGSRK